MIHTCTNLPLLLSLFPFLPHRTTGEVYELLAQIGASSAEAKARRILFGLGFDAEMQVKHTSLLVVYVDVNVDVYIVD